MAEPFPRASPGVPSMAMALRLGAGPAKAAPTRRSVRRIFSAAHVAGKNDPDSFRLAPETRKGCPLPGPFPGGRGTKVPGRLPASIGSACCPPGREAAPAAGGAAAAAGWAQALCCAPQRSPCGRRTASRKTDRPCVSLFQTQRFVFPQCLLLPPFRGHLPGGRGEVSFDDTSRIRGLPRRKIPPGLCHFFRRRRRSEISYGNDYHEGTGSGAYPGHREERAVQGGRLLLLRLPHGPAQREAHPALRGVPRPAGRHAGLRGIYGSPGVSAPGLHFQSSRRRVPPPRTSSPA